MQPQREVCHHVLLHFGRCARCGSRLISGSMGLNAHATQPPLFLFAGVPDECTYKLFRSGGLMCIHGWYLLKPGDLFYLADTS